MKISDFKKLENVITNQDFNKSYGVINKVMLALSYFGHLASIFLAYYFVSKIFSGAIPDQPIFVGVVSIILLSGLELLKRDFFDKASFQYFKNSGFTKDMTSLILFSSIIISLSFYSSISGAREFSSKSKELESKKTEQISTYTDSLNKVYSTKISGVESEIQKDKDKIDIKDKEQTGLESVSGLTSQQRNRVRDLKSEKQALKDDVTKLEGDIKTIKAENETIISDYTSKINETVDVVKKDNTSNSILFIIISTLIELVILFGVSFNEYFKFRSYKDFKAKLDKDPNYHKWELYDGVLNSIYSDETKINDKLPTNKQIADMSKLEGIGILTKDVIDFTKTLSTLRIIRSSGSARYFNKTKEQSLEILKKHFNID